MQTVHQFTNKIECFSTKQSITNNNTSKTIRLNKSETFKPKPAKIKRVNSCNIIDKIHVYIIIHFTLFIVGKLKLKYIIT